MERHPPRELAARVQAELDQDVADVVLGGPDGDVQPVRDVPVGEPVGDQRGDLPLPIGQRRLPGAADRGATCATGEEEAGAAGPAASAPSAEAGVVEAVAGLVVASAAPPVRSISDAPIPLSR